MKIGLRRVDALCRSKCNVGVDHIAAGLWQIWPPSLVGSLSLCVYATQFCVYSFMLFKVLCSNNVIIIV